MTQHNSDKAQADGPGRGARRALINRADGVIALILLAGCALLYYVTTTFSSVPALLSQNITPAAFPRILLAIIALLSLGLAFEHLWGKQGWEKIDKERATPIARSAWLSIAVTVAIGVSAPYLGTLLTILAVCIIIPLLWGERRFGAVALFAVLFTAVVTFVFNLVLKVYFEPGLLGMRLF